jgi:hypothetical protein
VIIIAATSASARSSSICSISQDLILNTFKLSARKCHTAVSQDIIREIRTTPNRSSRCERSIRGSFRPSRLMRTSCGRSINSTQLDSTLLATNRLDIDFLSSSVMALGAGLPCICCWGRTADRLRMCQTVSLYVQRCYAY